jgi:hypothetical protein
MSTYSKKDYIEIAQATYLIRNRKERSNAAKTWDLWFREDGNPYYDSVIFFRACGLDDQGYPLPKGWITKEDALHYREFHHIKLRNKDGSALRCRANGKCQVWKTRPADFCLPVVHGLKDYFYLTNDNANEWRTWDITEDKKLIQTIGLVFDTPPAIVYDKLLELRMNDKAKIYRSRHLED